MYQIILSIKLNLFIRNIYDLVLSVIRKMYNNMKEIIYVYLNNV